MALCAIRFFPATGQEQSRLVSGASGINELLDPFRRWQHDDVLVGRNMDRTCRRLAMFSSELGAVLSPVQTLNYLDIIKESREFPAGFDDSYKSIAALLRLEKPDEYDVLEKAKFTVKVVSKLYKEGMGLLIKHHNFTMQPERLTQYKKEGSQDVSRVPVSLLQTRTTCMRFSGTYVAFTGTLKIPGRKMERKEAMERVRQMGGIVTDRIDEHVTHLVTGVQIAGREKSQKERQAEADGIVLIPADVFFTLID